MIFGELNSFDQNIPPPFPARIRKEKGRVVQLYIKLGETGFRGLSSTDVMCCSNEVNRKVSPGGEIVKWIEGEGQDLGGEYAFKRHRAVGLCKTLVFYIYYTWGMARVSDKAALRREVTGNTVTESTILSFERTSERFIPEGQWQLLTVCNVLFLDKTASKR